MCLFCLVQAKVHSNTKLADELDYFANNGLGNSVAIIQHPACVHVNGVSYVSYQGPEVAPYVASFTNTDNGQSFVKKQELLRRPNASWPVTAKIHNAHPEARIIVAEKLEGQQWHKMYLLGDSGVVSRSRSELKL
jgi:hypothetical protein